MSTSRPLPGSARGRSLVTSLALALLSILVIAPSQSEAFVTKKGVFKVKVKGVQHNKWSQDKDVTHRCDVASKGSGWERYRFQTPFRRVRISAYGQRRADSVIFPPMKARGKVTRQGKINRGSTDHLPEDCFGDGGDGKAPPPPPPDCGTKRFNGLKLSLFALGGKLTLDRTSSNGRAPKLFRNCDWVGRVWPYLLTEKPGGKGGLRDIAAPFTPRLVFNKRFNRRTGAWSKVIMIARGKHTGRGVGYWYTTSIEWTVTLKRLR